MSEFVQFEHRCDQATLAELEVTSRRNETAKEHDGKRARVAGPQLKRRRKFWEDTVTMG